MVFISETIAEGSCDHNAHCCLKLNHWILHPVSYILLFLKNVAWHCNVCRFVLDLEALLVVAAVYRPPKPHKVLLADFLRGIIPNFDRILIHICCPQNSLGKDFISLTEAFDLVQLVKGPTHIHVHTLDL